MQAMMMDCIYSVFWQAIWVLLVIMCCIYIIRYVCRCIRMERKMKEFQERLKEQPDSGRTFVLWTLLTHARNPEEFTPEELMAQDKEILNVCRKMAAVLTDAEFDTLRNINRFETDNAAALVSKYEIKED